jgi:hypothetical protein
MRSIFLLILLLRAINSFSQAKTYWQEEYQLSVLDFQAEVPETPGGQGHNYYLNAHLNFDSNSRTQKAKQSTYINNKVSVYFYPDKSWLQQGEGTETWLKMAQMEFDLLELYARKYRQQLAREKTIYSNPALLGQMQQNLKTRLASHQYEMQRAISESDSKREAFHESIKAEIAGLSAYCRECEPAK